MRSPFSKLTLPISGWIQAFPPLVLSAVLAADWLWPHARLVNPLLLLALAGYSMVLSPRAILFWTFVYGVPVVWSTFSLAGAVSLPFGAAALRIAAFLCAGILSCVVSAYRLNLAAEAGSWLKLFDALPIPLVVSDIDGEIQFANEASCLLLRRPLVEFASLSYFSLFSDPQNRGSEIARYLELFEEEGAQYNRVIEVQTPEGSIRRLATCLLVNIQGKPYLVTQIGKDGN